MLLVTKGRQHNMYHPQKTYINML